MSRFLRALEKVGLVEAESHERGAASADGDQYEGLPVTGFEAVNVINANAAPGQLANYSGFFKHRGSRSVTTSGVN